MKTTSRRDLLLSTAAALSAAFVTTGCSGAAVRPKTAETDVPSAGRFPHVRLGLVLEKFVSEDGLVDYAALAKDTDAIGNLDAYLAEVARISPKRQPHLFPTEPDAVVYWLNAHNAAALSGVLAAKRPATVNGAFDGTTYLFGKDVLTLSGVRSLVRKTYRDCRHHLALVAARRGGPALFRAPYAAATLDAELDAAARLFLSNESHARQGKDAHEALLHPLVLEHRADFEREMPSTVSGDERLIVSVNRFRPADRKLSGNRVTALPADLRLNDVANR